MKTGIKTLADEIAREQQVLADAHQKLMNKCEATAKTIGGIECRFDPDKGVLFIDIGEVSYDAEVFAYICNWFQKHYGDDVLRLGGSEEPPAPDAAKPAAPPSQ